MNSNQSLFWQPPSDQEVVQAVLHYSTHRRKSMYLTISMKLLTKSRWREDALLEGQRYVTRLIHTVLEQLREDINQSQTDHAFDYITRILIAQKNGKKGRPTTLLGDALYTHFKHLFREYPITSSLRVGSYRQAALMLLNWYIRILKHMKLDKESFPALGRDEIENNEQDISEQMPSIESIPAYTTVHRYWATQYRIFEQAASTLIPFGRHRGKSLAQAGKREIRWLVKRLPPLPLIKSTLNALEILLALVDYTHTKYEIALMARHPWKYGYKGHRSVRANHLVQRNLKRGSRPVRLANLSKSEQERLYHDLIEMERFAEQFATIRSAIDIFLQPRIPTYPHINEITADPAKQADKERRYRASLNWFSNIPETSLSPAKATQLEQEAMVRLEQDASALKTPLLQPLPFPQTMRGKLEPFFTLLYNTERDRYVLGLVINPRGYAGRALRVVENNLIFINSPHTLLSNSCKPDGEHKLLLFALEYGREYHDRYFLKTVMEQQYAAQAELYIRQMWEVQTKPDLVLQECIPKSAIGSAKITSRINGRGHPEFFVHLPVPIKIPPCTTLPDHIVGIHEHDEGYNYAVLHLHTKQVLAHGAIEVPDSLMPKQDDRWYSDNYAFHIANSIVAYGKTYNAVIGIENTVWKRIAGLSRSANRMNFTRPRKRIMTITGYKALLEGLMAPCAVSNVSQSQDCSVCGYMPREQEYRTSKVTRHIFTCGHCRAQIACRENTALVVAQRTISSLVERWQRTIAKKQHT